jgi:hypothetical protein
MEYPSQEPSRKKILLSFDEYSRLKEIEEKYETLLKDQGDHGKLKYFLIL